MKIRFRTAFWAGAAILIVILLFFAFRPQSVAADMSQTTRGPMQVTVRDEGYTRVRNEYVVSAPVGGRLLRVDYKPGAAVQAGEIIARVLPGDPAFLDARTRAEAQAAVRAAEAGLSASRAEVERAEAEVHFAETEAERLERLRADGLTSAEALDRARLQLKVAQSALATARDGVKMREAELEAARVRLTRPVADSGEGAVVSVVAPVSGRVLRVTQESESVIAAGAEIMLLGDPNDIEVVVEMLSTDAVQVRPGGEVIVEDWGGTSNPLEGRVRLVEPFGFLKVSALGVEEQRVNVIVDFIGPPGEWMVLGHGYRVEAAIVTWREDDVIQVPVAALFRSDGGWAVFRVESGRAILTPVEVGRDNGRMAQILWGIEAGETVILYPGEQLSDGARVQPR